MGQSRQAISRRIRGRLTGLAPRPHPAGSYRALRRPDIRYWQGETWFFGPRQRVLPLWLRGPGNCLLQLPTPLRRGRVDRCDLLSASSCFVGPSLLTRNSPTFNRPRRQSYSISDRDAQRWAISSWMTYLLARTSGNRSPHTTTQERTIAMVT